MNGKCLVSSLFLCLLPLICAGCGEVTPVTAGGVETLVASAPCIGCHGTATSPVTGEKIVEEWKLSHHNTETSGKTVPGYGASCANCHEPDAGHPNSCGRCHGGTPGPAANGHDVTLNPDTALKCLKCHIPAFSAPPHFNNMTSPANAESTGLKRNGYPASFVTSQGKGKCRNCHNPHNPTGLLRINGEWAGSGHGDVNAEPWRHYDFKTRGTTGANPAQSTASDCVRCHTTTGYINYVTSGFTDIRPWGEASDKTKEVLQCNACHDKSYDFTSQRKVGTVTSFYNYSSPATKKLLVSFQFPDVGKSNICMACHTGRESGLTLAAIAELPSTGTRFVNYSTQSFINSHYLTAGATIFGVSGFQFPTLDYADPSTYVHKNLGVTVKTERGSVGPCITCHMQTTTLIDGRSKPSHKFNPELSSAGGADCVGCHAASPLPAGATAVTTGALLEQRRNGYKAALTVLASALKKRKFTFASSSPYFSNKNWQTRIGTAPNDTGGYGAGTGANTMGAAFNFNLLVHDPGGFAHNSTYAKRLIYDSIVWTATGAPTPAAGQTIADIINNTTLVPDDPALVATPVGAPVNYTGSVASATRNAAISWLTNGTGQRP